MIVYMIFNQNKLHLSSYIAIGLLINLAPIFAFVTIHGFRPFIYNLSILYLSFIALRYRIIRQVISNKLVFAYILLILYHTINCYLQEVRLDIASGYLPFFLGFYSNLVVLIIVCALYYQNPNKTVKYLVSFYVIFCALALVSPGFIESLKDFNRAKSIYIHPNQLSQCASMGLFTILMYRIINKKRYFWTAVVCVLPIISIFISGSRNGFFQLLLVIFTFMIGEMLQEGKRNVLIKLIIAFAVAVIAYIYIRNNSIMGERLMDTDEIAGKFQFVKTGTVLDFLGDRQIYYILGFSNFMDHPIFGIGLRAFGDYNNFDHPLHSEYMIHLSEGGFIGVSLYLFFIFILGKRLLYAYLKRKDAYSVTMLLTFVCYLMIGLVARECYYVFFFPILGVLIAYTERERIIRDKDGRIRSAYRKIRRW